MNIEEYIASGIIERFVLQQCTEAETAELMLLSRQYPQIMAEIEKTEQALMSYAAAQAPPLNPAVKFFTLAMIDYTERLKKGEQPLTPPLLSENTKVSDFKVWLDRPDMQLPEDFALMYAKILGYTPQAITALAWLKYKAPQEIHQSQVENFLILEGSCEIHMEGRVIPLKAGDYFSIGPNILHEVRVTSAVPCKFILQRVAA